MKMPKELKIGGHIYKVVFPYQFTERGDIAGQHDSIIKEIRIDPLDSWSHKELPDSSIKVILLHEILHAIDSITGRETFKDESVCNGVSESLYQIIHDNKLIF